MLRTLDTTVGLVAPTLTASVPRVDPAVRSEPARIVAIDLARALAVVMMVQGHCLDALLAPAYATGTGFAAWLWIRGLSSVVFATLAGYVFAVVSSRHWQEHASFAPPARRRVGRMLSFLVLGYALHFPVRGLADFVGLSEDRWRAFLQADVLQMIAVSLLALVLLVVVTRERRRFAAVALTLGIVTALVTPLMRLHDWGTSAPAWLAAYFYESGGSNFPLFPWSGFVLLGAGLGALSVDWQRRGRLYVAQQLARIGMGLLALTLVWQLLPARLARPSLIPEDNTDFVFLRLGIVLLLLAGLTLATGYVTRLPRAITAVGNHSLLIYFAHLVLVYGSIWGPGLRDAAGAKLDPMATLGLIVAVEFLMIAMALGWDTYIRRFPHLRAPTKWAFAVALAVPLIV